MTYVKAREEPIYMIGKSLRARRKHTEIMGIIRREMFSETEYRLLWCLASEQSRLLSGPDRIQGIISDNLLT